MRQVTGSVLVLAGVDPSGAAGLQRDVWAIQRCGQRALAIPTCLTLQSRVARADAVDLAWLADTLDDRVEVFASRRDFAAIKVGLVVHEAVWRVLLPRLARFVDQGVPLVVDPVRGPSSGRFEVEPLVRGILRNEVAALGAVLTPNLPELTWLSEAADEDAALQDVLACGYRAVFLKAGHRSEGSSLVDRLAWPDREARFSRPRRAGPGRRGTGCVLASFLAAGLAEGLDVETAARVAGHRLQQAWDELDIAAAPQP